MRKIAISCAVALALSTLAGCAGYVDPTGPVAHLRVVLPDTMRAMRVMTFGHRSGKCEAPKTFLGSFDPSSGNDIVSRTASGMKPNTSLNPRTYYERRIPAGSRYALSNYVYVNAGSCNIAISFVPEENADYQAVFSVEGRTCHVFFHKLDADGQMIEKIEPSLQRETCPAGTP